MLDSTIKEEIRKLTPEDRIALIQYAVSLIQHEYVEQKLSGQTSSREDSKPTYLKSEDALIGIISEPEKGDSSSDVGEIDMIPFFPLEPDYRKKNSLVEKDDGGYDRDSLVSFLLSIAEEGEQVLNDGAAELPADFATNHDYYLYGKAKK